MPAPMDNGAMLRKQVGQRIRQLRRSLGLTQQQLAARAGITPKLLGELERGKGNPTLETLASLAAALGVTCAAFFPQEPLPSNLYALSDREALVVREALAILDEKLKNPKGSS